MKIAIASDHGGFDIKNTLINHLENAGHTVEDFGPHELDPEDDYPDFAFPAAESVSEGKNEGAVLICRSGEGICMVANKVKGVRAAVAYNSKAAEMMRRHNDSNAICLAADNFSQEELLSFVDIWLASPFDGGRHGRRVEKIVKYEESKS